MARVLSALALLAGATAESVYPSYASGSVFHNSATNKWSFVAGKEDPAAVAWGSYVDMQTRASAFGELSITTNAESEDDDQMYAAGFLEGALTQARIWSHANNTLAWISSQFKGGVIPPVVEDFFAKQDAWTRAQIATNSSAHWQGVGYIHQQLDGLVAGYAATAPPSQPLSFFQIASVGAVGDYLDLITALTEDGPDWDSMNDTDFMAAVRKSGHCSALVKVTADLSELFFAHVAWFIFQSTTRIFKHYHFLLKNPAVAGREMSFSSYPAYLSSLDDWYAIWDSGIAVLETTNNVFNKSLYKEVKPESLFAWQRVRLGAWPLLTRCKLGVCSRGEK